jgi:hypothetical protein
MPEEGEAGHAHPGTSAHPHPQAWWTPWAKLGWVGRIRRGAAIAFTLFHLAAMFAMGAPAAVRKHFAPVFGFYDGTLKMTNTWGMFSKRPSSQHVRIEAVDADGKVTILSDTRSVGKSIFTRFVDARVRKIQSKLDSPKDRGRFGNEYVDGWCRFRASKLPKIAEVRAVQETHELRDDRNRITRKKSQAIVLRRTCGPGVRARSLSVETTPDEDGDGDDN